MTFLIGRAAPTQQQLLIDSVETKDVQTTVVYTHVLNQGPKCIRSPMDKIPNRSYADQLNPPASSAMFSGTRWQ